jgi:ABC-2 type transport system ATP-binding protein
MVVPLGSMAVVATVFAAHALAKRYGATQALEGVDLELRSGELVGLLGPNGAGKSTLVKIGCGLVRPSAGTAHVCGAPAGSARALASLGYLAELFRFPGWLSADELLRLHQRLAASGGGAGERRELLSLVGLADVAGRRVAAMSKGMQQRLGIAQALIGSPPLLILDEPTSALDPAGRRVVRGLLEELRDRGLVSEGRPAELTAAKGVEIETEQGLRSYPDAGREQVPGLVAALVAEGARIYGVHVRTSTLEEAYLEAVGGETA